MPTETEPAGSLPIVQYWHDGDPPDYIVELLDTFREHNPDLPLLLFDRAGAAELIAERLGEREVAAFLSCAVPAMQADYFRYCAGLALGGLCCDADVRCVASLREIMPSPGEGWLFRRPRGVVVNGLFAVGSPGHPLLDLTVEVATANIECRRPNVYMATGPGLWTTLYWLYDSGSLDAFLELAPDRAWQENGRACRDVIGDFDRLRRAFDGVGIRRAIEVHTYLRAHGLDLPYKESDLHWSRFVGEIYR